MKDRCLGQGIIPCEVFQKTKPNSPFQIRARQGIVPRFSTPNSPPANEPRAGSNENTTYAPKKDRCLGQGIIPCEVFQKG